MKTLLIFLTVMIIPVSCSRENRDLYSRLESTEYGTVSSEREAELKEDIKKFKDILEEKVEAARGLGSSYKMLGKLYLENEMYLLAFEQFKKAAEIYPENPILYYYAGLCSARYSKSVVDSPERFDYIQTALANYKRAVDLDNKYSKAVIALSVLYLYELENPAEAAVILNNLIEFESRNYEALFLLANAYIQLGKIDEAISVYENIAKTADSKTYKKQAEINKKELEENIYDWN